MFFIVGIFIAVFLLLLLLIKKNKSRADKILVVWLFFISINQVFHYFYYTEAIFSYPDWLGVDFTMPILNGVFLFFYVLEITGNTIKNKWSIGLHLIPTISLVFLAIPFYILSGEEKIYVFNNDAIGFEWYTIVLSIVIAVSGLVYSIWSLVIIKRHRIKIQDSFSNTDKKELQWLQILSYGFAIIWIVSAFFSNIIIFSAVVIFVLCIAIFGINQLTIFNSSISLETVLEKEAAPIKRQSSKEISKGNNRTAEKYEKSGLNEEKASEIYANLNKLVANKTIYQNNNLTLVELSKQLQVHPNHLSQVINEKEEKNFYNYINSLRITEFIRLASLPENKKYTMISLAYDCGFSTKSTFNKHFKLVTGKTPTDFFRI